MKEKEKALRLVTESFREAYDMFHRASRTWAPVYHWRLHVEAAVRAGASTEEIKNAEEKGNKDVVL